MTTPVGSATSTKGGSVGDGDGIGSSKDRGKLLSATRKVGQIQGGRASQVLSKIMTLDNLVTIGRAAIKAAPK